MPANCCEVASFRIIQLYNSQGLLGSMRFCTWASLVLSMSGAWSSMRDLGFSSLSSWMATCVATICSSWLDTLIQKENGRENKSCNNYSNSIWGNYAVFRLRKEPLPGSTPRAVASHPELWRPQAPAPLFWSFQFECAGVGWHVLYFSHLFTCCKCYIMLQQIIQQQSCLQELCPARKKHDVLKPCRQGCQDMARWREQLGRVCEEMLKVPNIDWGKSAC